MKKKPASPWKFAALALTLLATGCQKTRTVPKGVDVTTDYSAVITPLIRSISAATFSQCTKDLCAIPDRVTGHPGCNAARDFLVHRFERFGWSVTTTVFHPIETTAYSVIAEWPGTEADGHAVIVSAHYDSWGKGNTGAVDNASGCAGLVSIAQCVSSASIRFHRTIRLIAFSCEEMGQRGSKDYVKAADPTRILAVFNLDAIAPRPSDRASVLSHYINDKDGKTAWLPETFMRIKDRYAEVTGLRYAAYWRGGKYKYDSDPFEAAGIPAITITGLGENWANTSADTIDKVSFDYGRTVTQLAAAAAFTLAGPVTR